MDDFNVGVVIPVGPGRTENVRLVLEHLAAMTEQPHYTLLVLDGPDVENPVRPGGPPGVGVAQTQAKHEPGMEHPRNVGARLMPDEVTHLWFLDSDVIVGPDTLAHFSLERAIVGEETILVGPYLEHMPPGVFTIQPQMHEDPRWPSFDEYPSGYVSRGKLNDGLACFGGNLIWPRSEFERIGGFWNDLYCNRCEDGELGLRAVAEEVPIGFAKYARGWHLWHEVNLELTMARNARDVPLLNARHPWVEGAEVFVVERDGKRFDQRCPVCRELINTGDYWNHAAGCGASLGGPLITPGTARSTWHGSTWHGTQHADDTLILPDGMA
jgi:GT2 family glycosyltransferase